MIPGARINKKLFNLFDRLEVRANQDALEEPPARIAV